MADNVDIFVRAGMRVYAILSIVPAKKNDLDKADAIYHTLVLGLNTAAGARAIHDLSNPYVHRLFTLSRATANEAHHLLGFLRFSREQWRGSHLKWHRKIHCQACTGWYGRLYLIFLWKFPHGYTHKTVDNCPTVKRCFGRFD